MHNRPLFRRHKDSIPLKKRRRAFMFVLACLVWLNIIPTASGFISLQQQRGVRPNTMVNKVHAQHWNVSYSYADDCPAEARNNDAALTEAITEVLQMWLEPLREYTDRPIVNDFRYVLDAERDASDLTVIFHCKDPHVSSADVRTVKPPQIDMRKGTKVTRNFMAALVHEMGHAFGLADTYIPAKDWGKPGLSKGGQDSTKGTQPSSAMSGLPRNKEGGMIGTDDKNGIIWLYKVIYEGLSIRDCFFNDYQLEHEPLGCRPKHPLIFEIKYVSETTAVFVIREDENLDLNARDADGMMALHHAFINEYTKVVDALLGEHFEKLDINVRDRKGHTALHYAVLLKDFDRATEIVERLLEHPKIKVNIRRNDGRTPAQLAKDTGRFQLTKLIWEHPTAKLPPWSVIPNGKLAATWGHLKKRY